MGNRATEWLLVRLCLVAFVASARQAGAEPTHPISAPVPPSSPDTVETLLAHEGEVYLGGTRLSPPFVLTYHRGLLVVNHLQLPAPEEPEIVVSDIMRVRTSLMAHIDSLARAKLSLGWTDDQVREVMRQEYEANPLIKEVLVSETAMDVRYADGFRFVQMLPLSVPRPLPNPLDLQRANLREMKTDLDGGCLLIIVSHGERVIVPTGMRAEIDGVIGKVIRGEALSTSESNIFRDEVQEQFRRPVSLVKVP